MAFKLNDVVSFLETTLGSNSDLRGNIKWTFRDDTAPTFKNYGVHIYLGLEDPKTTEYRVIGPRALEKWQLNCDMIVNKNYKPRIGLSDSYGLSYWENQINSLLFHKQNSGTFRDSWWDSKGVEDMADSHIIRGIFNCELDNQYPVN